MAQTQSKHRELGTFLRKSRVKAKLSQARVAKALRLSTPQCVSNWETGRTSPPLKHLYTVCRMYSVDADRMFDLLVDYSVQQTRTRMVGEYKRMLKNRRRVS